MNISGSAPCFPSASSQGLPMYPVTEQAGPDSGSESHSTSLLYNLSILKDKVHEVESLVSIFVTHPQTHPDQSTSLATASMGSLVQEIIVTASSMLFACQQMSLGTTPAGNNINTVDNPDNRICQPPDFGDHSCADNIIVHGQKGQSFYSGTETISWYGDRREFIEVPRGSEITVSEGSKSAATNYDIIELDAADLLAKYTHYCQVCGKGFKRDANLRMHMRAHGDEYKSSAALMNPVKNAHHTAAVAGNDSTKTGDTKYSCPQEGCRWNQKHAKFTPLKSVICVKNHYKRSHCPKMYVCKRCNRKQFSVLSDLRTHEKHCGDLKWQCSCGTTFSRKDKLMGHVALFVGHSPLIVTNSTAKPG